MLSMHTNCTIPNHMIPPSCGRPAEPAPPGVPRMWTRGPHAQNAGPRITARRLCAEGRRKQHLGRICDAAEGFEGLRRITNAPQVRLLIYQFISALSIIIDSALTQGLTLGQLSQGQGQDKVSFFKSAGGRK